MAQRERERYIERTFDNEDSKAEVARKNLRNVGQKLKSKKQQIFEDENEIDPLVDVLPKLARRKSSNALSEEQDESSPVTSPRNAAADREPAKKRRSSLTLLPTDGLGPLETLRTKDIQSDRNSAAFIALEAINDNRETTSPGKPRQIEGRQIRQEDELYGMVYGMMLGIRVLTGRRDHYNYGSDHHSLDHEGGRELTDEDYDYELELEFPPEGSRENPAYSPQKRRLFSTPPHKLATPFKFKDYMANAFQAVRSAAGVDESDYLLSIAGDFNYIEFIANSKSGQFFFYSFDGKYMIKTQTKEESKFLRRIMPQYVAHLANHPKSLLVRFFGMHRVKMSSVSKAPIYFVVMSSVFYSDLPIHVKYDLKGSTLGRLVSEEACNSGAVQKDLNLVESGRTFRLGPGLVDIFLDTLSSDALFLRSLRIMDYSLLVGIHEIGSIKPGRRMSGVVPAQVKLSTPQDTKRAGKGKRGSYLSKGDHMFNSHHGGVLAAPNPKTGARDEVYFFGIIDILQLYNTSKRAETFFKGITNNVRDLSSVDPDFYALRFLSFITDHTDYSSYKSPERDSAAVKLRAAQGSKASYTSQANSPSQARNSGDNASGSAMSPVSFAASLISKLTMSKSPNNVTPKKAFFSEEKDWEEKGSEASPMSKVVSPKQAYSSSATPSPRSTPMPSSQSPLIKQAVSRSVSPKGASFEERLNEKLYSGEKVRPLLPVKGTHSQPSVVDGFTHENEREETEVDAGRSLSSHPSFLALKSSSSFRAKNLSKRLNSRGQLNQASFHTLSSSHAFNSPEVNSRKSPRQNASDAYESSQSPKELLRQSPSLSKNTSKAFSEQRSASANARAAKKKRERDGIEPTVNPHFGSRVLRQASRADRDDDLL